MLSASLVSGALCLLLFASNVRSNRLIALAFVLSWIGARASTAAGTEYYLLIGMTAAAFVCIKAHTKIASLIAIVYAGRVLLTGSIYFGADMSAFWAMNFVPAVAQLVIALGGLINDPGELARLAPSRGRRRRSDHLPDGALQHRRATRRH